MQARANAGQQQLCVRLEPIRTLIIDIASPTQSRNPLCAPRALRSGRHRNLKVTTRK